MQCSYGSWNFPRFLRAEVEAALADAWEIGYMSVRQGPQHLLPARRMLLELNRNVAEVLPARLLGGSHN